MSLAVASICYDRPELHAQSLASLAACQRAMEVTVIVFCDAGGRCAHTLGALRDKYGRKGSSPFANFVIVPRLSRQGLSANILQAYDSLFDLKFGRVILLEEDIIVSEDFLLYHDYCHRHFADARTFSIIGWQKENYPIPPEIRPEAAVMRLPWFASNGCSISRDVWENVCRGRVLNYLHNPVAAFHDIRPLLHERESELLAAGPGLKPYAPIQDMFLNMIREAEGMTSIYPFRSRTQHIGFYGSSMPSRELAGRDPADPKNWESTPYHTKLYSGAYAWERLEMVE